jgi:hypothetical protein
METQEQYYYHAAWLAFGASQGRCCVISDHLIIDSEEKFSNEYRILKGPYKTHKEALKGKHADE